MVQELIINRIFNERHTSDIIMYLYLFGPKHRTEIYDAISRNPRMPIKLDLLESYGVIKTYEEGQRQMLVSLTSKGTKLAAGISNLEKILGGNVEAFRWGFVMSQLEDFDKAAA